MLSWCWNGPDGGQNRSDENGQDPEKHTDNDSLRVSAFVKFCILAGFASRIRLARGELVETAQVCDVFTRALAGDRSAFAELVRKHQAMVFSIALHSLRDAALAEELAQEVFLDLYEHLRDLQSAAHVEFWLRKVASRRCIDYVRRRRRQPSIGLEDAPEPATATRGA